jgi:hypothetical protein
MVKTGYWLFYRELLAHGRGVHQKNAFQSGNTSSWTRNPPRGGVIPPRITAHGQGILEGMGFYRNCQLIGEESPEGRGFHRDFPAHWGWFRPARSKCVGNPLNSNNSKILYSFLKYKYKNIIKMKNWPNLALLKTSYLSIQLSQSAFAIGLWHVLIIWSTVPNYYIRAEVSGRSVRYSPPF